MPDERTCEVCGKTFIHEHRGRQRYCSEECYKQAAAEKLSHRKKKKKTAPENTTTDSIIEIAKAARAAGLTYGQYVDRMRQEGKC